MSLFQTIINRMKADLKNDSKLLEEELLTLQAEVLDDENRKYKSEVSFYINSNKRAAIEGSLKLIDDELKLFDEAFTGDMIKNLDYFMDTYSKSHPNARAWRIINARLDIVRFINAKISIKDFKRDYEGMINNIKGLRRFLTLNPPYLLLQKPHDVIKGLNFDINHQDAQKYGYENFAKKIRFSDTALKYLMEILTEGDRKRMPRIEDDYTEKHSEYLYGEK